MAAAGDTPVTGTIEVMGGENARPVLWSAWLKHHGGPFFTSVIFLLSADVPQTPSLRIVYTVLKLRKAL